MGREKWADVSMEGQLCVSRNEDLSEPAGFKPTGSGSLLRGNQPEAGGWLHLVPRWGVGDSELTPS